VDESALAVRIADQAKQRLGGTSYQFLRFVDCCFQNGVLTLRGRVPSFYLKQMAQSVLANLEGVDRIDNRVDVVNSRGLSSVR
jgi:osmotically-inducible protein OsmY